MYGNKSSNGFEEAVNEERNRGEASTSATVHKATQQTQCGIGVKLQNGSVIITSIASNGLFANKGLKVGMTVKTINNVSVRGKTAAEATQLIKGAVGQVTIVATGSRAVEASTSATVYKATQQTQCGIGVKLQNGSVIITSIASNGLFANKGLKVGMTVKTINNVSVRGKTAAEATQLIKGAVGQVTIVAGTGHPPFETFSGTFDMSYVDRGKQFCGHVVLELKNNERGGYSVTGTTSDADGTAVITEGLVTFEGDAWWVDEVLNGNDKGLKVLTTGKFDWSTNNFEGTWRASTGQSGRYTSFESTNVTKTFDSAPVTAVVATPLNPTFTQTPIVTAVAESSSPVVVATANKVTKDMTVGIGIKAPNGTPFISSIQPDGLFATSALRVGMDVQSINSQSMSGKTAGEATQLIKDAVGEITIVAGWNLSVSSPIAVAPIVSSPPAGSNEPEVYVPSYR